MCGGDRAPKRWKTSAARGALGHARGRNCRGRPTTTDSNCNRVRKHQTQLPQACMRTLVVTQGRQRGQVFERAVVPCHGDVGDMFIITRAAGRSGPRGGCVGVVVVVVVVGWLVGWLAGWMVGWFVCVLWFVCVCSFERTLAWLFVCCCCCFHCALWRLCCLLALCEQDVVAQTYSSSLRSWFCRPPS